MKKILFALLCLALCGLFACGAADEGTVDGFEYETFRDGTARITGYKGAEQTVAIPAEVGGCTVTILDMSACVNATVTEITIPETVHIIREGNPFRGFEALERITVAPGSRAFSAEDGVLFSLEGTELIAYPAHRKGASYTIPDGVKAIEPFAFCKARLREVVIPSTVNVIEDGAFLECRRLAGVVIPDSVTALGNSAFRYCVNMKTLKLPAKLRAIGTFVFFQCERLNEVVIPEGVRSIGDQAFACCHRLRKAVIPDSVTFIHDLAFDRCERLTVTAAEARPEASPVPTQKPAVPEINLCEAPERWSPWIDAANGGRADVRQTANGLRVTVQSPGTEAWHVQPAYLALTLEEGASYRLSFDVSADPAQHIAWHVMKDYGDYASYCEGELDLTGTLQHFECAFTMEAATDRNCKIAFDLGGGSVTVPYEFEVRNLTLVKTGGR